MHQACRFIRVCAWKKGLRYRKADVKTCVSPCTGRFNINWTADNPTTGKKESLFIQLLTPLSSIGPDIEWMYKERHTAQMHKLWVCSIGIDMRQLSVLSNGVCWRGVYMVEDTN